MGLLTAFEFIYCLEIFMIPENESPCRLYLITPPHIPNIHQFADQLRQAIQGGDIASLQLRLKAEDGITPADPEEFIKTSEVLLPICKEHKIAFILNDLPELVHQIGADGVHIGMDELSIAKKKIAKVRMQVGDSVIIGASCYNSEDYAILAAEQGVDYISFGAFYPTNSKRNPVDADIELLEWWSDISLLPSVAIGGITPDNLEPIVRAGADFVAAISGVWDHPEGPEKAIQFYNKAIVDALEKEGMLYMEEEFFSPIAVNDNLK